MKGDTQNNQRTPPDLWQSSDGSDGSEGGEGARTATGGGPSRINTPASVGMPPAWALAQLLGQHAVGRQAWLG